MRAWVVHRPGPVDDGPLVLVDRADPEPGPGEIRVRVTCAGCAAPTSTWPRATSAPHGPTWSRATRSSGRRCARPGRDALRGRATASASPGCDTPAGPAGSACGATRTSASTPASRAGTPTAATPSGRWSTSTYAYRAPRRVRRRRGRAAAVRRHHRLPRPAPGRAPAGRPPGDLRVRRLGPPRGAGRARPGTPRSTCMTRSAAGRAARARPRCHLRPATRSTAPPEPLDSAILFAPAGELVPVALAALDRGGTARHRRHPPERHPAAATTAATSSRSARSAA